MHIFKKITVTTHVIHIHFRNKAKMVLRKQNKLKMPGSKQEENKNYSYSSTLYNPRDCIGIYPSRFFFLCISLCFQAIVSSYTACSIVI